MATITDQLITALRVTGVAEYRAAMRQATTSMEGFAAAEATALQGLAGFGVGFLGAIAPLQLLRRSLDYVNDSFAQFAKDDAIARRVGFSLQQIKSSVPLTEFQKLAQTLSDVTGLDDELILSQAEVLARFQLTGKQIEQILPRIVDLAARTAKPLDQVALAVGSALLGRVQALNRLGIEFKRTGDRAADFTQILRRLQAVQGAAGALGQTPEGELLRRATAAQNLSSAVGGRFAGTGQVLLEGQNRTLNAVRKRVESGSLDAILGVDLARSLTFQDVAEAGTAAARRARGLPARDERAAAEAARNAALQGNSPASTEKALGEIAENTKKTHQALLRGGGTAAAGAVSVRELNQALGTR